MARSPAGVLQIEPYLLLLLVLLSSRFDPDDGSVPELLRANFVAQLCEGRHCAHGHKIILDTLLLLGLNGLPALSLIYEQTLKTVLGRQFTTFRVFAQHF